MVIIDNKARDYILEKGGTATIEKIKRCCTWASVALPSVRLGEPKEKIGYELYKIDSMNVYISKSLKQNGENVHIKLSSLFGILKSLNVFGFEIM